MRTNIQREGKHALVMTEEEISAVIGEIEAAYGQIAISAKCNEGSELVTTDPTEIFNYENPNFRKIESLKIQAGTSYRGDRDYCFINISKRAWSSYSLLIEDSNDARALKIATELEKRLGECKPWYSLFTRFSVATLICVIYFFFTSIAVLSLISKYGLSAKTPDVSWIILLYIFIPSMLLYAAIIACIQKGWDWIFPKVWFSVGRQVNEFEKRRKFRQWIFGGVCGSLFLGVVGNIIAHFILK